MTGCSAGTHSGSMGDAAMASSHVMSRPAVHATSVPRCGWTTTEWTVGAAATASSTVCLIGTVTPRRVVASAVITATAPESTSRDAIAVAENPEKTGTATAPAHAMAWNAVIAATDIGMTRATRSPGTTPSVRKPPAKCATSSVSWPNVRAVTAPSSRSAMTAGWSAAAPAAWRPTQLHARFSVAPTNHVVHAGPALVSQTCSNGSRNPRSSQVTTASQNHSGSSSDRCSSSA